MLVLTRKKGQSIMVNDNIEITGVAGIRYILELETAKIATYFCRDTVSLHIFIFSNGLKYFVAGSSVLNRTEKNRMKIPKIIDSIGLHAFSV